MSNYFYIIVGIFLGFPLGILVHKWMFPLKGESKVKKDFEFPKKEPYIYESVFVRWPGVFLFSEYDGNGYFEIKLGIEHDKSPCGKYIRIATVDTESLEIKSLRWQDAETFKKLT